MLVLFLREIHETQSYIGCLERKLDNAKVKAIVADRLGRSGDDMLKSSQV